MNATKLLFTLALVVMTIATPALAANTNRSAQIAHERDIPIKVAADRMEACLREDPAGTRCKPKGFNVSPAQFLEMIQANPELPENRKPQSLQELSAFLKRLHPIPFSEPLCLAGREEDGQVVTSCHDLRGPRTPKEVVWADGNTPVLAGDCLNGVVAVVVKGTKWQPYAAEAAPTDHSNAAASRQQQCPVDGARMTTVFVYQAETLATPCAREYVIDKSRYSSGAGKVGAYEVTGSENVFSLQCGREMRDLVKAGQVHFSTTPRRVQLSNVIGDQAFPIFRGTATGNVLTAADENSALLLVEDGSAVHIPPEIQDGFLVWTFPDGGMASPTNTGLGIDVHRLRPSKGCNIPRLVGHAIEGGDSRQVAASSMYSD
jgi:hypothetical protein